MAKTILLTGAAGFVGAATAQKLLARGVHVVGVDNMNDYYDVRLKNHRLKTLKGQHNFTFHRLDIENLKALKRIFKKYTFNAVINLAARAGVRYSLVNPHVYYSTNTQGTVNLLELCKDFDVKKFVLASTSSLYAGQKMPFVETLEVNRPISPYAASKKGAEVSCYAYHYIYGIDVTVLRYFTVYGPAGRPDMSVLRFIKWVEEGVPIKLFGDGSQSRDFTYIDDIANGTVKALKRVGFEAINLGGGNNPYTLKSLIRIIEQNLGKQAKIKKLPFSKVDMKTTWADITKAKKLLKWQPKIGLEEGIGKSVQWYLANKKWLKHLEV